MHNKREEIDGMGINLGVVIRRTDRVPVVHSATWEYAEIVKELMDIFVSLDLVPSSFPFSSLQIFDSCVVRQHRDKNIGESLLFMTGDYTGGNLNVGGVSMSLFRTPYILDGQIEHFVEPFAGQRWSFAFYVHPRAKELSPSMVEALSQLGFQLPPGANATPTGHSAVAEGAPEAPANAERTGLLEINVSLNVSATCLESCGWKLDQHIIYECDEGARACSKKLWPNASITFSFDDALELVNSVSQKGVRRWIIAAVLHEDERDDGVVPIIQNLIEWCFNNATPWNAVVLAQAPSRDTISTTSDQFSTWPFLIDACAVSAVTGEWAFWAISELEWPKGTRNIEGVSYPRVKPANSFKGVTNIDDIIEKGWKFVGVKGLSLAELVDSPPGSSRSFSVTNGGASRHLRSFEAEDLLGVGRESSNYIGKIQGEKLDEREARRKLLLISVVPKQIVKFVLEAVCPSPPDPS